MSSGLFLVLCSTACQSMPSRAGEQPSFADSFCRVAAWQHQFGHGLSYVTRPDLHLASQQDLLCDHLCTSSTTVTKSSCSSQSSKQAVKFHGDLEELDVGAFCCSVTQFSGSASNCRTRHVSANRCPSHWNFTPRWEQSHQRSLARVRR